ncbi:MAG: hypothetical protein KIT40_05530 [Nitrospira sp.]|nr:hypothetical protein [Nitrospira sp.]
MLELLLVLASLVVIGLTGLLTVVATSTRMVELGLWALALGLLIGIPTDGGITSSCIGLYLRAWRCRPAGGKDQWSCIRYSRQMNFVGCDPGLSRVRWDLFCASRGAWRR